MLRQAVRDLTNLSERLRSLASDLEAAAAPSSPPPVSRHPRATSARAAHTVATLVAAGVPEGEAIALAAEGAFLDPLSVRFAYRVHQKHARALERFAQRYLADRMYRAGYSRAEIARVIGCHPNSVARLRKEMAVWWQTAE